MIPAAVGLTNDDDEETLAQKSSRARRGLVTADSTTAKCIYFIKESLVYFEEK